MKPQIQGKVLTFLLNIAYSLNVLFKVQLSKVIANYFLLAPVSTETNSGVLEFNGTRRYLGFVSLWLFLNHLKSLLAVELSPQKNRSKVSTRNFDKFKNIFTFFKSINITLDFKKIIICSI